MPVIQSKTNPLIYHRSIEPDASDFVSFFWWQYGGMDYAEYPLNRPPLCVHLTPQELKAFKAFYGAEPLRVRWSLSSLWGGMDSLYETLFLRAASMGWREPQEDRH